MQFTPRSVCSYLLRVIFSKGNVAHESQYCNKLTDGATDIEKTYREGAPSESELTEEW